MKQRKSKKRRKHKAQGGQEPEKIAAAAPVPLTATPFTISPPVFGSPVLIVTRPEQILPALAQGLEQGKPVLIDIPEVQRRLSWLTTLGTILKWSRLGGWIVSFLASWWLGAWLDAQLPNKNYLVPEWTKFYFWRQPDNKVILNPYIPSPHEE
jgi:hypothetical protein